MNNVLVPIHACTIYIRYHAYTGKGGQNTMVIIMEVVVYSCLVPIHACTIYIRYHAYTGKGGQNTMVIIIEVVVYSCLFGHTLTPINSMRKNKKIGVELDSWWMGIPFNFKWKWTYFKM